MSRITIELAGHIATKLTEKSRLAFENMKEEYREYITQAYEEQTPKEAKMLLKSHPEWIQTKMEIKLDGHGFDWHYIKPTRPVIMNNYNSPILKLNAKLAAQIQAVKTKVDKAEDKYKGLKDESKQALLTLRTFNNIRKELPEAAPYLPPPMSNALVVNFDSLKKRIQNQPEVKQETVKQ